MFELKADLRTEDFGTSGSHRLIKAGKLPGVIYGKGKKPVHIALDYHEFKLAFRSLKKHEECIVILDKKKIKCTAQDVQYNLMLDTLIHVDFLFA